MNDERTTDGRLILISSMYVYSLIPPFTGEHIHVNTEHRTVNTNKTNKQTNKKQNKKEEKNKQGTAIYKA